MATTEAEFLYAENRYNGFALVTVTPESFTVDFKGVRYLKNTNADKNGQHFIEALNTLLAQSSDLMSLFKVEIKRKDNDFIK